MAFVNGILAGVGSVMVAGGFGIEVGTVKWWLFVIGIQLLFASV